MTPYPTTANFPGTSFMQAVSLAYKEDFNLAHMQLCPQQLGQLTETTVEKIQEKFPQTQFRLHANVGVLAQRFIFDASSCLEDEANKRYIKNLKNVHRKTKSDVYSYHAGYRTVSLEKMKENSLRLGDILNCVVVVEALYPDDKNSWLINSLDEYEWMVHNVCYALDLSHLQIIYHKTKKEIDLQWVHDIMIHSNCKEIHIAGNDGVHDNHRKMSGKEWWVELLDNPEIKAHVFTEENYRR